MLSSNDVRDVKFSKAMGGYKQEEVDTFLDTVEEDFRQYEAYVKNLEEKLTAANAEVEEYKTSQASLQSVLISAQQLADNIVNDAKATAQKIVEDAKAAAEVATGEAKNMLVNFDEKLGEKRDAAKREMDELLKKAEEKKAATDAAAADAVRREQALFDKLRLEISEFKGEMMELYKRHIELISKIPDCVAMDAQRAAEAVALEIEKEPDVAQFIASEPEVEEEVPQVEINLEPQEELTVEEIFEQPEETTPSSKGFVVMPISDEEDEKAEDEEIGFSNSFFSKKD